MQIINANTPLESGDTTDPMLLLDFREEQEVITLDRSIQTTEVRDIQNRKDVDRLFYDLNQELKVSDYIQVSFRSLQGRRNLLHRKFTPLLGTIWFYTFDFLVYRILARLKRTRKIFLFLTKGKNQAISTSEGLGRIASCNFKIVTYISRDGFTHVLAKKVENQNTIPRSNQGMIIGLSRVGYQGKLIKVYKLRTMRPYSEFLQTYLIENHGMEKGDKIINDFRIARWGELLRKVWLDEIPMIWNFLKGDLKLVGVRPLSKAKFSVYPESLQKLRIKAKPGLLPPYYADLPTTPEGFFESEEIYTNSYLENPLSTDFKYFLKIVRNIIWRGARSK
ncbi:MAG: sugar transferase [Cytophagales bacterium]|nr:sugar transferase [Cytophagales bacterium]